MDLLAAPLAAIAHRPLATILHLGAGTAAARQYAGVAADRVVLVEGEPDAAAELRRDIEATPTPCRLIEAAVAPQAGPLQWHRFNLRTFNGPVPASHWAGLFTRLRELDTRTVDARTLDALIDAGVPDNRAIGRRPSLLIVDLPGQEDGLLAATDANLLIRFDWVSLRHVGPVEHRIACAEILAAAGFEPVEGSTGGDGPWATALYRLTPGTRFDRIASSRYEREPQQRAELEAQIAAAEARAAQCEAALGTAKAELDRRHFDVTAARASALELRERHEEVLAELGKLRATVDDQRNRLATAAADLAAARKRGDDADAALAAARKQLADADAARKRLQEQLADRDDRQRRLDAEVVKAEAQLALMKEVMLAQAGG